MGLISGTAYVTITAPIMYTAYMYGMSNPYFLGIYCGTVIAKTFL